MHMFDTYSITMRGNFGIYLDFENGNHYKAVFGVEQQMPTIPVSNQVQTISA